MDAIKRRLLELEEIYRCAIEGLRSKARVAANDHISGNVSDPVAILTAAANELQTYLGCSLRTDYQGGSVWYGASSLELTLAGEPTRQFGPMPDGTDAVRLMVDIEQEQLILTTRDKQVAARRPSALAIKIEVHPAPGAEVAKGGIHDRFLN